MFLILTILVKALLDANIIRNIITNIFHFNVGFFKVLLIYSILESKPTLKWNIFVIILRIILASKKAFIKEVFLFIKRA